VIPDPLRGMGARKNSVETQKSDHAPRSGPEIKNGSSGVKYGAPVRLTNSRSSDLSVRLVVGRPGFDSMAESEDLKSWYSQLPCLAFSIQKGIV